jgi:hypothetical protein
MIGINQLRLVATQLRVAVRLRCEVKATLPSALRSGRQAPVR